MTRILSFIWVNKVSVILGALAAVVGIMAFMTVYHSRFAKASDVEILKQDVYRLFQQVLKLQEEDLLERRRERLSRRLFDINEDLRSLEKSAQERPLTTQEQKRLAELRRDKTIIQNNLK